MGCAFRNSDENILELEEDQVRTGLKGYFTYAVYPSFMKQLIWLINMVKLSPLRDERIAKN